MEERAHPTIDGEASRPAVPSSALSGKNILLGVTGSIAAYKAAELVRLLKKAGAEVQVLMTRDAARFIPPLTLGTLSEREVLTEIFPENEAGSWTKHVHLGLWADLFLVAPATATTLSKLAAGVCDSMLTAVALSARCPLVVAPAMDHDMMLHPATQRNLATLRADGVEVIEPEHGELASGLVGTGRLPEPATLVERVVAKLTAMDERAEVRASGALAGWRVLVTAGPTHEAVDPVRFLTNGSTGTMGYALAAAAAGRGADVTLISGPTALPTPDGVRRINVTSADEMHGAVQRHADADLVVMAAAVADYTPVEPSERKVKKGDGDLTLRLRRTPDILAALGEQKRDGQTLVGFALETHDGVEHARGKLERKNLDWIVLNHANEAGAGFGPGTNRVTVLGRDGSAAELAQMPKAAVAEAILDCVLADVPTLRTV
ncbi:MAG: bifunctional phosphopantothenoylcysteine decarboxylase/phosphopantothenate--cysteine ligase CoaBC [Rhodothermales bacterium]